MGNFDAGSIEARLTLDRSQFKREMELARAQARAMEANDLEAKVNVDVDNAAALAKVAQTKAAVDSIPNEKNVKVDMRTGNGVSRTQFLVTAVLSSLPLIPAVAAPATAAIVGLSASLAAAGAGAGVLALGMIGAIQHIKDFNGHVSTMPASMRAFVGAQNAMNAAFDRFVAATQNQAFALMAQGLNLVASILPRLIPIFNAFATVATGALTAVGNWFNGPEGQGMLRWIQTFGAQQFGTILAILGNVARTLLNLMQAFSPFATTMMTGLQNITAAWVNWSSTLSQTEGFRQFMAYVAQVGPMVMEALVSIGRAIIAIGIALAPLGPPLLSLITNLGNFISAMNPAVLRAILVTIIGLVAAFAAYEAIMKVVAAAQLLWNGAMIIGAALSAESALGIAAYNAAMIVTRGLVLAWTAAQWLLNAALTANPIGIIIVAIAALVAGIIYAYQHFEAFRNVVNIAWTGIRAIVGAVVAWFTGTAVPSMMSAVAGIVNAWNTLRSVASAVFGAVANIVRSAWSAITNIISTAVNQTRSVVTAGWNAIRNVVSIAVTGITAVVRTGWAAVSSVISAAMGVIRSVVSAGMNAIGAVVRQIMSVIVAVFTGNWSQVRSIVNSSIATIRGVISSGLNAAAAVARAAFNSILSAARSALGALGGVAASAAGAVRGVFAGAGGWLVAAGRNIIGGLISGIRSMIGSIGSALGGIGSFIASHKGPPSYDKVMLKPHGRWIMGGLINSILGQVPRLGNAMNQVNDAIALQGRPRIGGASVASTAAGSMVGGGSGVSVTMNVYNPVAEPTSITATRNIKDLAVLGVFK